MLARKTRRLLNVEFVAGTRPASTKNCQLELTMMPGNGYTLLSHVHRCAVVFDATVWQRALRVIRNPEPRTGVP